MKPDEIAKQYDAAIATALKAVNDVENRYNAAIDRLNTTSPTIPSESGFGAPTDNPAYKQVADQVRELEGSMAKAREQHTILLRQKAEAQSNASREANLTPEQKAKLEADAAHSLAQADQSKAQAEYLRAQAAAAGAKDENAALAAQAQLKNAQAALIQANNGVVNAQSNMIQATSQAALVPSQIARNEAEAGATTAGIGLTSAQAQQSLANAAKLQEEVEGLKRQRLATSDAQIQKAIDLAIQQKEKEVARIQAEISASDAGVLRGQQGPLYGYEERVEAIRRGIAAGTIKDADQAYATLEEDLLARIAGTTLDARQQAAKNRELDQRGQGMDLVKTRTSAVSSFAGSALGDTLNAARYGTPGSDAGAGAFGGSVGALVGLFGGPQGFRALPEIDTNVPAAFRGPPRPQAAAPAAAPALPPAAQPVLQPQPQPQPMQSAPPPAVGSGAWGSQMAADSRVPNVPANTGSALGAMAGAQVPVAFEDQQALLERMRQQRMAIVNGGGAARVM